MTYCEHLRHALRLNRVPIFAAEHALTRAKLTRPWLDDEFQPPDSDGRLMGTWEEIKAIVAGLLPAECAPTFGTPHGTAKQEARDGTGHGHGDGPLSTDDRPH